MHFVIKIKKRNEEPSFCLFSPDGPNRLLNNFNLEMMKRDSLRIDSLKSLSEEALKNLRILVRVFKDY